MINIKQDISREMLEAMYHTKCAANEALRAQLDLAHTKCSMLGAELSELRAENDKLSEELEHMTALAERLWKQRKVSLEAARKRSLFSADGAAPTYQ